MWDRETRMGCWAIVGVTAKRSKSSNVGAARPALECSQAGGSNEDGREERGCQEKRV